MEIEMLKVADLIEYKNNAKLHPQEQIDQIIESINQFGFNDPIAVDENNIIIEGHGRLYALQEMGIDKVPCIRLSHLSEEEKKAYILIHNKTTMNTDFDLGLLNLELDNILSIDMSDFGFVVEDEDFETTEQKVKENDYSGSLVDDFVVTPQSIFDTRQGVWIDRKRKWKDLGIAYTGIDLRSEQIDANYKNAREIGVNLDKINWICDDSSNVDDYIDDESADLIFACPPYFDLEVYSDNEKDISNMSYDEFCSMYTKILQKFANKLKSNRFAIVTISDVRDKKGFYRDLTGVTKQAFSECGIMFYNDIILINSFGSGVFRARRQMNSGRKVIRSHQNVLVFYKGNPKKIKEEFGELAVLENLEVDE